MQNNFSLVFLTLMKSENSSDVQDGIQFYHQI